MPIKVGFNLLRPQLAPEDKWDAIYNWVNSTARVIVILVEVVVIGCFVARVIVDRQARELEETLIDNKGALDQMKDEEEEIRRLQKDIKLYAKVWEDATNYSIILDEIYSYNPDLFQQFTVNIDEDGGVDITGVAIKKDIGELERTIKNSEAFSQVELASFKPGGEGEGEDGEFNIIAQVADKSRGPIELEETEQAEYSTNTTESNV